MAFEGTWAIYFNKTLAGNVGIEVILVIQRKNKTTLKEVIEEINEYPSVVYAIESI